jgi:hypothetical protein
METERINRFWAKVDIKGPTECWLWKASVNSKGYGSFAIGGKKTASAHKISWALEKNDGVFSDPKDHIMHSCDTKRCVNPNHLELGTALQNNRDARTRGTARNYRPSQEENCKKGHPRTPENTHHKYNTCVICMRDTTREAKKIKREESREEYNAYHREYYRRKESAKNGIL